MIFFHVVLEEWKQTSEDNALSWYGSLRIWVPRSRGLGPHSYLWHRLEAADTSHTSSDKASLLHLPLDSSGVKRTNMARHLLGFHADSEGMATSTPGHASLARGCQCEVRSTFPLIFTKAIFQHICRDTSFSGWLNAVSQGQCYGRWTIR